MEFKVKKFRVQKAAVKYQRPEKYIKSNAPNNMNSKDRVLSLNTMPAGKETCNAKLKSRDGYCQQTGLKEFKRCKFHVTSDAFKIFSDAMSLEDSTKLNKMIEDTMSMDNELASAKVLLVKSMEEMYDAQHVRKEYLHNVPIEPEMTDDSEVNQKLLDNHELYLTLHAQMLEMAERIEKDAYFRCERLIKTLTEGVFKNKRMLEGNKYTMDVKQVRDIIKTQLEVMAANCSECPNLRSVIKMMRNRMKDIYVDPSLSKSNREAAGVQAYQEELGKVEDVADAIINAKENSTIVDDDIEESE
jgi:hypothetical protein